MPRPARAGGNGSGRGFQLGDSDGDPYDGAQIVVNATRRTRGYDLATGKVLWQCGGQTLNVIPSPVRIDDLAIAMSGFQGTAAYAIPLARPATSPAPTEIAWHYKTNMR